VMPIICCSVRKTESESMRLFWSRPRARQSDDTAELRTRDDKPTAR
jgi:hypothetical protein